jgi:hypothetical protein
MRGSTVLGQCGRTGLARLCSPHPLAGGRKTRVGPPLDHWAAVKRLALMEFDVRPHEPYDVAISGIFIGVMLVMTLLIFALA